MLFKSLKSLFKKVMDWQHWPFYIFYFPLSFTWVYYYIKSRSLWYFTASNPTLSLGGFEGEAKSEMYKQLPPDYCPKSIFISPQISFNDVVKQVVENDMSYPFIVKPDVGMKGI